MTRYSLGVQQVFSAKHYLIGGDFGPESDLHSHDYRVEIIFEGNKLSENGFLVNIATVQTHLSRLAARFNGSTLNSLPEFEGKNPSCEEFCNVFLDAIKKELARENLSGVEVKIWESSEAWASVRLDL